MPGTHINNEPGQLGELESRTLNCFGRSVERLRFPVNAVNVLVVVIISAGCVCFVLVLTSFFSLLLLACFASPCPISAVAVAEAAVGEKKAAPQHFQGGRRTFSIRNFHGPQG